MSYCLGPVCRQPRNPSAAQFCQSCGLKLSVGDRYRPLQPIGQGSFGRTFLAVDEYLPSKPRCVIKQFFPKNLGFQQLEKATELFQQEAARLDQLGQHPQIPQLLAHFAQPPYQYLIQTYVDGPNLAQELAERGSFSEDQIRGLLQDLLPVLQFIHEHKVIHRDIKPENIIRHRASGQVLLVDFGASKFATGAALHQTGTVIGSAGYAAPEQIGGKAIFASDLYSLGVTCIHLLTDMSPFDLYSFTEGRWVWSDYLQIPVSDHLSHILNRMLEPAINRRYASAAIALTALDPKAVTAPALAIPRPVPPPPPTATKPRQFNPISLLIEPTQKLKAQWTCVRTLYEHSNSIAAIAINATGKLIASGSFDKTIKLWHLGTGALVAEFTGHAGPVLSLAFNLDGKSLISSSVDDTIKLWDLRIGSLLYTLTDSVQAMMSLAIALSPDGQVLVSGSDDHTVKIWHLQTGKLFRTIRHPRGVTSVAISPDSEILASGSHDNEIRLWNFGTGDLLQKLTAHTRDINSIAISPDSKLLVSGSSDHQIKLWELPTGKLLRTLTGHLDWVKVVAISPDEQLLASGSSDMTLKLWDLTTGKLIQTLAEHTKGINAIAFSPDSQFLISGSSDRTIKIWRRPVGQ